MDNNDIIITLADYIKKQTDGFTLTFGKVEADFFLPDGALREHLETAATEAGYEIIRQGESTASLKKKRHSIGSIPVLRG